MIRLLRIQNLKLVQEATMEFSEGLNMITGETGAGKSMLLSAISLILGDRLTGPIVREGAKEARVEALVDIEHIPAAQQLLKQHGIDCPEQEVIIQRHVNAANKSKAYLNRVLVPIGILKDLGETLVDLHGQHQHQSLLNKHTHIALLDQHAQMALDLEAYQVSYKSYQDIIKKIENLQTKASSWQQESDFLTFQLAELNTHLMTQAQYDTLTQQSSRAKHAARYQELLGQSHAFLSTEDPSVCQRLAQVQENATELATLDSSLTPLAQQAQDLLSLAEDLEQAIGQHMAREGEVSPEDMASIEEKLYQAEQLQRKHGKNLEELDTWKNELQTQTKQMNDYDAHLQALNLQIKEAQTTLSAQAKTLSNKRHKAGNKLIENILKELRDLGMPHAQFEARILPTEDFTSLGRDAVEFFLSANKGTPLEPLAQIASGGEVSRIMLALKSVFAQADPIATMIFDEIDANLGGETALSVGQKLRQLATQKQLICIQVNEGLEEANVRFLHTDMAHHCPH